ncbi:MAG TPA: hypothetical protein PLQ74_11330 [Pseudomonadota bacterium]|nr:hypothetical protein [Rhodanobacteraceae bacterium]MBP9155005.1 hypothetical protein [Xanthomonadales bacterium]HQW82448.1 hypothetical protein [Pseudomonadota bacterium]
MAFERRLDMARPVRAMERDLNQEQLITLRGLERYGWELKFIRRPPFKPSIPIVFDSDRKKFAVLKDDGTLDENPGFNIRD